jgi:hypothetical protein
MSRNFLDREVFHFRDFLATEFQICLHDGAVVGGRCSQSVSRASDKLEFKEPRVTHVRTAFGILPIKLFALRR